MLLPLIGVHNATGHTPATRRMDTTGKCEYPHSLVSPVTVYYSTDTVNVYRQHYKKHADWQMLTSTAILVASAANMSGTTEYCVWELSLTQTSKTA